MFKAGQKVVCVKAPSTNKDYYGQKYPIKGRTYTIRDLIVVDGESALHLEEIVNKIYNYGWIVIECAFHIDCFRPLEDWENEDISELTEVLKNPVQTFEIIN